MIKYIPQTRFMGIIGTGDPNVCVASCGDTAFEASWLFALKDWIDKTWLHGYTKGLPEMVMDIDIPEFALNRGPGMYV